MFESIHVAGELQSELARLRADGRGRTLGELVDLVGACQSLINQATAVQTLAMAHVAAIEDVALEDGTVVEQHRGLGHQRLDAPALVSEQLGVSDAVASSRVGVAVDVVTRMTGVFESMGEGRLDEYRARIVSDELHEVSPEVCAQVVARIAGSLGTEPPTALRRRVRRALGAVDADLLRAKASRARSERSLCRWPGEEPGVDTWMGSFPAEQSRSGWAVVDGLARQYVRDGRATSLEQARADALMDLIHARATGSFVVQFAVPADQFDEAQTPATPRPATVPSRTVGAATGTGAVAEAADDELVTVAGLGMPGTTQVRRAWLETLSANASRPDTDPKAGHSDLSDHSDTDAGATTQIAAQVRHEVVACHADTGALLAVTTDPADQPGPGGPPGRARATESKAYRPPQALIDLVKARDGRCRFPGCSVSARFCDLDHVVPWPLGPTHPANLICLCRRHHRIKQSVRWLVRIDPDGTVVWTDPTDRLRTTLPLDFLQLEDHPASQRGNPPADRERPQHPDHESVRRAPVDGPGVLWSVWEEELGYQLAVADRDTRRVRPNGRRTGASAGRLESTTGLESFVLAAPFADSVGGRGRGQRVVRLTEGEPPF